MSNKNLITKDSSNSYNAAVNQINQDQREIKRNLIEAVDELADSNKDLKQSASELSSALYELRLKNKILNTLVNNL